MPPTTTFTGAQCATHAEAPAVAACRRCGRFVCEACLEVRGEDGYCRGCVERLDAPVPPGVKAALYLTALSLPVAVLVSLVPVVSLASMPAGIVAWVAGIGLTVGERRKLAAADRGVRSAKWLRAAIVFAVLWGLAWAALAVLAVGLYREMSPHPRH